MSPTTSAWRHRIAAGVAGAAVLVSTACSAAQQGAVGKSTAAGPVRDGGTLVVGQSSDADPGSFLKTSIGNILSEYAVFETLTLIDPRTGQPHGVLASSWTLAKDAKSMDLKLRDDVTFHSGRKLTADDVIFTIQKAQDPKTGAANQSIAGQISHLEKKGDDELTLTFKQPLPNIFDLFETMPILNKDTYGDYAAGRNVDGTGRFVWKSWTPGGKIMLGKYANYRDAKNTHLDAIEIDIIKDPTAMTAAVRSGRVQYGAGMAALDSRSLSGQAGYALVTSGGSAIPLAFDVTKPPFNNKTVRQAIQYAIDRNRIVQQVEGGQATATNLPWKPTTVGYDAAQAKQYTYQPDKAKQLLAQAGVKNTSFDMVTLNTPEATGIFQIVKNNLTAIGLNPRPVALAAADYDARIAKKDMGAPAFLMQASNGLSPASAVLNRPELLPKGNLSHLQDPEYGRLVDAVTKATAGTDQQKALKDYDAYYIDQAFAVPLIIRPTLTVRSAAVNGITPTQMGFLDVSRAWLSK
ncbi:ABC transporter substrate-binding protein [Actinoallomurus sp. CA-150999]|uniref:ABC transporter substrate-binding protein n=1 Tax=Actinoallomurus sp. CA-150999 TaxID=3239887 RepID=UPI003D91A50E